MLQIYMEGGLAETFLRKRLLREYALRTFLATPLRDFLLLHGSIQKGNGGTITNELNESATRVELRSGQLLVCLLSLG